MTPTFFLGLDLGQKRDHTAIAVIERSDVDTGFDPVHWARIRERRFMLRHLARLPLGTPYPEVVDRVRELVRTPPLAGACTLVVDATGVGAPVIDLFKGTASSAPSEPPQRSSTPIPPPSSQPEWGGSP